jgi:hypothetical protein
VEIAALVAVGGFGGMLERDIEKKLAALVKKLGGLSYKFVSPGCDGVPDRIVITPGGAVVFWELKTETGRLSPRQRFHLKHLQEHNCNVLVCYGWEETERMIRMVFDVEV